MAFLVRGVERHSTNFCSLDAKLEKRTALDIGTNYRDVVPKCMVPGRETLLVAVTSRRCQSRFTATYERIDDASLIVSADQSPQVAEFDEIIVDNRMVGWWCKVNRASRLQLVHANNKASPKRNIASPH